MSLHAPAQPPSSARTTLKLASFQKPERRAVGEDRRKDPQRALGGERRSAGQRVLRALVGI